MKQHNQIGKYTTKEEIIKAKNGKTFITPNNKEYVFNYMKQGNKYTFILTYLEHKMRISETDFNRINIDELLSTIERGLKIT